MSFSFDKFIKPVISSDENLKIYNDENVLLHSINPFSIKNIKISNNILVISMDSNSVINIAFSTTNESKLSIVKLQSALDLLKEKNPLFMDAKMVKYVNSTVSYDIYTALLTTNGTASPTAIVLENTIGGNITWSYGGLGIYLGTSSGLFSENSSTIIVGNGSWDGGSGYIKAGFDGTSSIIIANHDFTGNNIDTNALTNTLVEIKVYN